MLLICAYKKEYVISDDPRLLKGPGILLNDILEIPQEVFPFSYIHYSKTEVKRALRLLEKESIVKIIKYPDGLRFDILDDRLKECIQKLWDLFEGLIIMKINIKLKYKFESDPAMRRRYERL